MKLALFIVVAFVAVATAQVFQKVQDPAFTEPDQPHFNNPPRNTWVIDRSLPLPLFDKTLDQQDVHNLPSAKHGSSFNYFLRATVDPARLDYRQTIPVVSAASAQLYVPVLILFSIILALF